MTFPLYILNCHVINFWWYLIVWCFDGGENKYITVNSYGARKVKDIKDYVICNNKQQRKDAVAYFLFNCYFMVGLKIFCQIIGIAMWSDPAPVFVYFYILMKVNGWTK